MERDTATLIQAAVHIAAQHVELILIGSGLLWFALRKTVEEIVYASSNPLAKENYRTIAENVVSIFNAFFLISVSVYALYEDSSLWLDPVHAVTDWALLGCYSFGGYCLYDTVLMFIVGQKDILLYFHHFIGLGAVALQYTTGCHVAIGIVALSLMETTNPCLNLMWILRKLKLEDTVLYLVNGLLFVALYFVFRIVTCGYISYHFTWVYYQQGLLLTIHVLGLSVFLSLTVLCFLWFGKIIALTRRTVTRYYSTRKGELKSSNATTNPHKTASTTKTIPQKSAS